MMVPEWIKELVEKLNQDELLISAGHIRRCALGILRWPLRRGEQVADPRMEGLPQMEDVFYLHVQLSYGERLLHIDIGAGLHAFELGL